MFKMFKIKLNKKGFTLIELVVSTAIMATLAAVAIPAYLETQESAKGTKAMDTMNTIGTAIINAYMQVADQGSTNGIAIAEFTPAPTWTDIVTGLAIINYSSASTFDIEDIFPSGVPSSPFTASGAGWQIQVIADAEGKATWGGNPPILTMVEAPTFALRDKVQTTLTATFQMTATP